MKTTVMILLVCTLQCVAQGTKAPLWAFEEMNPCIAPLIHWGGTVDDLFDSLEARNIPRGRVISTTADSTHFLLTVDEYEYAFFFRDGDGLYFASAVKNLGSTKKVKSYIDKMHSLAFKNYEHVDYNEGIVHEGRCRDAVLYCRIKKWGGGKVAIVLQRMEE